MRIRYLRHAIKRLVQRSCEFSINFEESKLRVTETIKKGSISKSKKSKNHTVYYGYYPDNTSFFVVAKIKKGWVIVKTVIIKRGRE